MRSFVSPKRHTISETDADNVIRQPLQRILCSSSTEQKFLEIVVPVGSPAETHFIVQKGLGQIHKFTNFAGAVACYNTL